MMLGLIAVFAAIVYRLGQPSAELPRSGVTVEASVPVPPGARLVSADLDGNTALLTLESGDGATSLLHMDLATGRILGRYALAPE